MVNTCGFCGNEIEKGTGKIKFLKDGKVVPVCSMKCEKNYFKLKRVPRETKWTAEYKREKTMRLSSTTKDKKPKVVKASKSKKAE